MERITTPIILADGGVLEGHDYEIASNFVTGPQNAVIQVQGDGVVIRDVRIFGPRDWPSEGWTRPNMMGVRADKRRGLHIERVQIDGLPNVGIVGTGLVDAVIRDCEIRHCYVGLNLPFSAGSVNERILIERIHVGDSWAAPSAEGGPGDGMALNSLRDSQVIDCTVTGRHYGGAKATNAMNVLIRGYRGPSFQIQGRPAPPAGDEIEPARDILIEDCVFDAGLGHVTGPVSKTVQFTYHVASARMHRCFLIASGSDGHGVQVAQEAHVQIECCMFSGFNGTTPGATKEAYACDVVETQGALVNSNFAQVNSFVNQQRILQVR
jgi:hypothetical protein